MYLFISHSWKKQDDYFKLKEWLKESNIDWRDYSVPEHDSFDTTSNRDLRNKLDVQIKLSSMVVALGTMHFCYSDWLDFEIKTALKYGKPIVLIEPWGSKRTPLILQNNATKIVGWNKDTIIKAIKSLY